MFTDKPDRLMRIDLNADLAERAAGSSVEADRAVMRHITSANLACGGHAGDAVVMREAVLMALEHGVAIGAHPSFADREGFGRREMAMAPEAVEALVLFGLAGSELIRAGEAAGLRTAREVFADRAYREDGSLVPRSEPGAVIDDPDHVVRHAIELSRDADTICVHGDTPGAAALAARIRDALGEAGIEVKAVTAP